MTRDQSIEVAELAKTLFRFCTDELAILLRDHVAPFPFEVVKGVLLAHRVKGEELNLSAVMQTLSPPRTRMWAPTHSSPSVQQTLAKQDEGFLLLAGMNDEQRERAIAAWLSTQPTYRQQRYAAGEWRPDPQTCIPLALFVAEHASRSQAEPVAEAECA